MKKTQFTDARRNIRKRIVSYLSICLVIMLGIGAFLATRYMAAGITNEAAGYFTDRSLKDFELISSLGASEASIAAIENVQGVTAAEGVLEFSGTLQKGDVKKSATVLSLTEKVSVPLLVDGRLPAAEDELAIGEDFSESTGIVPGDTVTLRLTGLSTDDPLLTHEFTVTGLVKHPDYVHRNLTNTIVLPLSAFNEEVTGGVFSRVFVKAEETAFNDYFTQAYFDGVADTKSGLEDLTDTLADQRATEVRDEAYAKIDEEWQKALAELDSAEAEIADGEASLNSELAKARKKLNDAEDTLAAKLKEASKKLKSGELTIAEYEKKLAAAKKELAEGKAALAKARATLEDQKAAYEKAKAAFEENVSGIEDALTKVKYLIEKYDETGIQDTDLYKEYEQAVATFIVENADTLRTILELASDSDVIQAVKDLDELIGTTAGEDALAVIQSISSEDLESLISMAQNVMNGTADHFTSEVLAKIQSVLQAIADTRAQLDAAATKLAEAETLLAEKEAQLAAAEKELAAGEKTLNAYKAQLKNAKSELKAQKASAENKIKEGWNQYWSKKASYEAKLEEARALLAENREEAEAKLAEARAEVDEIDCDWLVLDRNANAGYIDVKSQLESLKASGLVFGMLFVLITALVCFSTLTIIIEEQKNMIGTVKAFGFHKREVLGKYLLFGVSAGIVGDILAVLTGLGLCEVVQTVYSSSNLYQYGRAATVMKPVPTVIIAIVMLAVCAAASVVACSDVLKSPASVLMKGESISSRRRERKTAKSKGGTLYSRLMIRNMSDDKARVIISIVIVAACCALIGDGIAFKLSFSSMVDKQEKNINLYDMRVDMGDSVTDEQRSEMISVIGESGADYTEARLETRLFRTDNTITALKVLAGDPDQLSSYYGMKVSGSGEAAEVSSDGVLIPLRMSENYGYSAGDSIDVLDNSMQIHEIPVTGTYTAYFDRICVTTPEGYEEMFGEDCDVNCCYIHLNGADAGELRNALLAINDDISFENSSDFKISVGSVSMLYNIIVYVTLGIAIFMSFLILTNLASIFVTRKKNELIVMRVNGFSIKQTKGYLAREALFTTIVGLVGGVLAGSALSPVIIRILEPTDLQFDRSYHPLAWVIAVVLEGLFAMIIYSNIFRRIKNFNLKDIA